MAESTARWGILGTGGIAQLFTSDLLLTGHAVTAVGSRTRESAERFAALFELPAAHASYESLVADPSVDLVYVATPHPFHYPNARLALEAGKHVLVEKPFTLNAVQAQQLVSLAADRGLLALEAMWTRWLPHMTRLREIVAAGTIGEVRSMSADHTQKLPDDPGHRLNALELGGGALLDLGVYPVSFASMVLGPPDRIVAISDPAFTGVDAQTSMLFSYSGGAQAVLTCTLSAKSPTRAAIVGTEGRIEIDGDDFYAPNSFTLIPRIGEPTRFEIPHEGHGLRHQADEVARCLRAGLLESPLLPLDETVSIMRTIDGVFAAAAG